MFVRSLVGGATLPSLPGWKYTYGPSKRKSKRFFLYRELFDIARDIISFFLPFPLLLCFFINNRACRSCRNTCWMENEVFEPGNEKRSTGDRLSKCLIVIAVLSSVGPRIEHEIHGQTQSTRYSDNWFVHRLVYRSLRNLFHLFLLFFFFTPFY